MQTFLLLFCLDSFEAHHSSLSLSVSFAEPFYCTILNRTVLSHSLTHSILFIVLERHKSERKIFSLLNLVFISLLTVDDDDDESERANEQTNDDDGIQTRNQIIIIIIIVIIVIIPSTLVASFFFLY